MTLGDIIKEYRTESGLSQDVIADRSGLSKAYISILERNRNPKTGEPPVVSIKTINLIARAIGSDFDTIFSKLDSDLKISISEQLPDQSSATYENKPAEIELDEFDKEFIRLSARLTPEQKKRQLEVLKDIVGEKDS